MTNVEKSQRRRRKKRGDIAGGDGGAKNMGCWVLNHRHRQAFTHSITQEIRQQARLRDVWPHLERDPLVLSSFTEGVSQQEDVIHSHTQGQEG